MFVYYVEIFYRQAKHYTPYTEHEIQIKTLT